MKKRTLITLISSITILTLFLVGLFTYYKILDIKETKNENEIKNKLTEYYNDKINSYKTENEKYQEYQVDIAFLGDSLTDGYDVKTYYSEYVVVNRGIGGDTTFGLEERLDVSVYDLKPKVIVMLIGINNLDSMFENYEKILEGFKTNLPDTKVILLSLTPTGLKLKERNPNICLSNVMIHKLAIKYDYEYIDLYTPLFDNETKEIYSKYTSDGIHFSVEGYDLITSIIKDKLNEILKDD